MNKKMTVVVLCICFVAIAAFIGGRCYQNNKTKKIVYVDFVSEEIEQVNETEHKYQFLPLELSNYIVQMCEQLEVAKRMADNSTDKNVVSFYLDLQDWIVSQLIKRKSHLNDEIKG